MNPVLHIFENGSEKVLCYCYGTSEAYVLN